MGILERLKRSLGVGGKIDLVNAIVVFLVLSFNLINQIHLEKSLLERAAYTLPFLGLFILVIFFKGPIPRAIFYLIIALGTTVATENVSDFSGAIFFVYAFHQIRKKWSMIFIVVITVLSIVARSITVGDTIPGNMVMLLVFFFIYSIYWLTIYIPEKPNTMKELTAEENELIRRLSSGEIQKEAGDHMGMTISQTNNVIKRIKKKTGMTTVAQITAGYGSINSNK